MFADQILTIFSNDLGKIIADTAETIPLSLSKLIIHLYP